ncbi:MAG: DNA cytosine methyltransferase [Scytonema sp. PMC 1069.18]|nr:DNA cytosine methyltransferase [Scytonema sp. PMC 1069.18]MEC4888016.1 DNA cytosine methyltransferase [Scytonema sp. PMC 1070.18]
MTYKLIDLFAGAGGLTTGFHLAGWESLCAIDIDKKALATYKLNYPNTKVVNQDICKVNPSELRLCLSLKREELTALIGGPPCQGFSRNIPAVARSLNDPRNLLYKTFLEFVQEFRPLYAVMENVSEILKAYDGVVQNEITEQLESFGYKVASASLNAAHYGVPQTRTRAFFIASLDKLPYFPRPTHCGDTRSDYISAKSCNKQMDLFEPSISSFVTVRDAIGDLPPLDAGQEYADEVLCRPVISAKYSWDQPFSVRRRCISSPNIWSSLLGCINKKLKL